MGTRFWRDFGPISLTSVGFYVDQAAGFWQCSKLLFRGAAALGKHPLLISFGCRAIRSCRCGSCGCRSGTRTFRAQLCSMSTYSTCGGVWPVIAQQATTQEDVDQAWMIHGGSLAGSIEDHCETVAKLRCRLPYAWRCCGRPAVGWSRFRGQPPNSVLHFAVYHFGACFWYPK